MYKFFLWVFYENEVSVIWPFLPKLYCTIEYLLSFKTMKKSPGNVRERPGTSGNEG